MFCRTSSVAAVLIACTLPPAYADNIKWHPSLPLKLGANLDPKEIIKAKTDCLKKMGEERFDKSAPSTVFTGSIIRDKQELYSLFSVSASASARFGLGNAAASVGRLNEVSFDSETINWALSATSDYGKFGVVGEPVFVDSVRNLPAPERAAICGSEYVKAERREAAVAAIFSFKTSSKRTRDNLTAALSASWSGGKLSTEVSNQLKKALTTTSIRFTFIAKGGEGLSGTSGLVGSFDNFDAAREMVAKYISNMTADKSPAAEYITALLPGTTSGPSIDLQDRTLSDIWNEFMDAQSANLEADDKLRAIDSYWYFDHQLLSDSLQKIIGQAHIRMAELDRRAALCKSDVSECQITVDSYFKYITWPSLDIAVREARSACNGGSCAATVTFAIRSNGPAGVGQLILSRMAVQTSRPVNSVCEPTRDAAPLVTFRCDLRYVSGAEGLETAQISVADADTHKVAVTMLLSELYPGLVRKGDMQ